MSTYPGHSPIEEKKPSFFRRPVPMWAFLLLVIVIILILFVAPLFSPLPPTIQQPLVLSPDSRTINIKQSQTITANFTVANINTTDTITATPTATLLFANSTVAPANVNVTLTIYGVQTGTTFTAASGTTVSFPLGASTLLVQAVAKSNAYAGTYIIEISLAD